MRLITKNGELDLPLDFTFEIEKTSTFFSSDGEQSIPVTLPATPRNLSALGQPLRLAGSRSALTRVDAVLHAGVMQRHGQLIISGASREGISASLALGESDLYSKYSEMSVRELFADHMRTEYSTVEDWVDYFNTVISGEADEDELTLMPVLVEKSDDSYVILNEPDQGSDTTPQGLKWMGRVVYAGGSAEQVPDGYGVTPFLYFRAFIRLLFGKMGLTIGSSAFDDSFFDGVVLLNNCADTICAGTLSYGDIVPSCTVGELLELLEAKFNVYLFVNNETATADLLCMDVRVSGVPDLDISGQLDSTDGIKLDFGERERIVLSSDTSLDGAAPPEDTLKAFHDKYPVVSGLDEDGMRKVRHYSVVLRLATGEYYMVERSVETATYNQKRIGTNYFTRDRENTEKSRDITAEDVLPPMVMYKRTADVYDDLILAPYVGARIHRHTSYDSSSTDDGQSVIFAFDAGLAVTDSYHAPSYRLATTQQYNNAGAKWHDGDLTPESLFSRFFSGLNGILMNCTSTLTAKVDFTPGQLLSLNMGRLKLLDGVPLLPKTVRYSVGAGVICGESEFLVVKEYSDDVQDEDPVFSPQLYTWQFRSSLQDVLEELEQVHAIVEYDWNDGLQDEFIYLPPPTADGQRGYDFSRTAHFRCTNQYGTDLYEVDREIDCWYESVPIEGL